MRFLKTRFGLRFFLIVVAIMSLFFAWIGENHRRYLVQKKYADGLVRFRPLVAWSESGPLQRMHVVILSFRVNSNTVGERPTSTDLEGIGVLQDLEVLDLSGTDVDDDIAVELVQLQKLRVLNLDGTSFTDEGVCKLPQLVRLETLVLTRTLVRRSAVENLYDQMAGTIIEWE